MSGDLWSRLTNDVNEAKRAITASSMALYHVVAITGGVVILFVISWKLTVVMMALVPLLGVGMGVQSYLTAKYTTQKLDRLGRAGQVAEEILSNMRIIKASLTEKQETRRYGSHVFQAYQIAKKTALVEGTTNILTSFLFNMGILLSLLAAGYLVLTGQVTIGGVVIYLLLIGELIFNFAQLPEHLMELSKAVGASQGLFELVDRQIDSLRELGCDESSIDADIMESEEWRGDISFEGVTFAYPSRPDQLILENFSLTIPANTSLGILGPSGSGKSTIIALLMKFYEPLEGTIRFGSHDLRRIDTQTLRRKTALVLQDAMLFSDTIAGNISYGFDHPDRDRIIECATQAQAHEFISKLSNGYDTIVNKSTLSGGQKQRLSIARALYRQPSVILLDEYTSSLDRVNRDAVVDTITKILQDKTAIVVSHSLETLRNVDASLEMTFPLRESREQRNA